MQYNDVKEYLLVDDCFRNLRKRFDWVCKDWSKIFIY